MMNINDVRRKSGTMVALGVLAALPCLWVVQRAARSADPGPANDPPMFHQLEMMSGKPLTDTQKHQLRDAFQQRSAEMQAAQMKFVNEVARITGISPQDLRARMGVGPGGGAGPAGGSHPGTGPVGGSRPGASPTNPALAPASSMPFTPLTDLQTGSYKGFTGGLYGNGSNVPPPDYLQVGMERARAVQPRNGAGQPDAAGKVVLLSIGMSNTTMEFQAFQHAAAANPAKNPDLVIVDGAQGGQDAETIKNPDARYWDGVEQRLRAAGVTDQQVQAVWLKEARIQPHEAFPADAQRLEQDLAAIVGILHQQYRNLQLVYLSSRTYGGYATTPLNPEPYAYQSAFAVRWLIEDHIKTGAKDGPWLGWGPYLWTNGTKGRTDGLVWAPEDVGSDGTHPSASGRQKVADLLLKFFTTDPTAKAWFVK